MDKHELSVKIDELKRLSANGQFRKAGKVLETIEIKKIKNIKELQVVINILMENTKYDQAKELLIYSSKKTKSRRVIHQLIDVCIKSGQMESAIKYMREFRKMAPDDPYNYVFQYQMAQFLEESYEKQIQILENLKQYEYMEKWAYELAKVYHRAGREADCIEECEDLILWFGEGVYVEKARLLKQYLTDDVMPNELLHGQNLHKNNATRSIFTPIARREEETQSHPQDDTRDAVKEVDIKKETKFKREDTVSHSKAFAAEDSEVEEEYFTKESNGPMINGKEGFAAESGRFRHRVKHKPLYQSAFNFIEDMESREQEEELNHIIEVANLKKEQQDIQEIRSDDLQEDRDRVVEEVQEEVEEVQEEAKEKSAEEEEKRGEAEKEATKESVEEDEVGEELVDEETTGEPRIDEEHAIANEQEVKQLVNETADLIAEQISMLFFQTEDTADEREEFRGDTINSEEGKVLNESKERENQVENQAEIDEVSKTEDLKSKETVQEDVDKLIKMRRQRVTTKKLNELVQSRIGKEVEAKEYLGQFAKVHSVAEQILRSLESISDAHNSINIILCGQHTFDETYFARRLTKLFYALNLIKTQKLVILNQEKFLAIDFDRYIDKIKGGCIIVEEVKESSERLRGQIQKLHENECLVMLEVVSKLPETKEEIQEIEEIGHSVSQQNVHRNREASIKEELQLPGITEIIWLEAFDADDLMAFAEEFVKEKEYIIEEDAKKYFMKYVEELLQNQASHIFCKVLEKISKAYHCANQRNRLELRNIAEFGNYEDAIFMSIKCTDFANEN